MMICQAGLQVERMTVEWDISQVSVWRLHEFVSKQVEDKHAADNIQHIDDRSYRLLRKVFQDIIRYNVLA
jgi:hypothetical protein